MTTGDGQVPYPGSAAPVAPATWGFTAQAPAVQRAGPVEVSVRAGRQPPGICPGHSRRRSLLDAAGLNEITAPGIEVSCCHRRSAGVMVAALPGGLVTGLGMGLLAGRELLIWHSPLRGRASGAAGGLRMWRAGWVPLDRPRHRVHVGHHKVTALRAGRGGY